MNKLLFLLLIIGTSMTIIGCSFQDNLLSNSGDTTSSSIESKIFNDMLSNPGGAASSSTEFGISSKTGNDQMNKNCKLIVKGKDITSENYVYLDFEKGDVVLPLTAVMSELGVTVEWQNATAVKFEFNQEDYILDLSKSDFGLPRPPGSTLYVRKIADNEILIDSCSITGLISQWVGAKINIDFDEKIIVIG